METNPQHIESVIDATHFNRRISIWLDSYDDIFSDFDPRPFLERTLSDDFIGELKKVSREDDFDVNELALLVPQKTRNPEIEHTIIRRLHSYFRKGSYYTSRRVKINQGKGLLFAIGGVGLILVASYLTAMESKFIIRLMTVLFEPAGWFFVWTGMDNVFFAARQRRSELEFYSKMTKAKVVFEDFYNK